jgi:antagonist of KipI
MPMGIRILKPGLLSTIQDIGRMDFLNIGVPISGPMDELSARLVNLILGNDRHHAVIEVTQGNFSFTCLETNVYCFSGSAKILINGGQNIPLDTAVNLPKGTVVKLQDSGTGYRTYIGVLGGWHAPTILGSKSTCIIGKFGGHQGRILHEGDELYADKIPDAKRTPKFSFKDIEKVECEKWKISKDNIFPRASNPALRIIKGREWDWFAPESQTNFLTSTFTLSAEGNRIAQKLDGAKILRKEEKEMLSTAVSPGTIQVNHAGQIMILLSDAQTTGGYPRIGQVAQVDLPILAQLRNGQTVKFQEITIKEAEKLYIYREAILTKLQAAIYERYRY